MEDSMEENKKKIIFWINGKNEESNFNLFILPETNTLRKLKDELFYEKKLNKSLYDKIKIFNHKGMEIDDIDVSDLTSNQVLYLSLDCQKFNELNYY